MNVIRRRTVLIPTVIVVLILVSVVIGLISPGSWFGVHIVAPFQNGTKHPFAT